MNIFCKIFKDCLTGRDNQTYDFMHFLIVIGFFAFLGFEVHEVWVSGVFNEEEYAKALMWMYSGGGSGIAVKNWVERVGGNNHEGKNKEEIN